MQLASARGGLFCLGDGNAGERVAHHRNGARLHGELAKPEPHEQRRVRGLARHGSAQRQWLVGRARGLGHVPYQPQHARVEGRAEGREQRARAVDGQGILNEVVRSEGEEVGLASERVGQEGRAGHLDHHAELDALGGRASLRAHLAPRVVEQGAHGAELVEAGDHGHEHAHAAGRGGPNDGAEVGREEVGSGECEAHRTLAEHGVSFAGGGEARGELVAPEVERADGDRVGRQGSHHALHDARLLVLVGRGVAVDVQELGSVEAHPARPHLLGSHHLALELHVGAEHHCYAVICDGVDGARLARVRAGLEGSSSLVAPPLDLARVIGRRVYGDAAAVPVDHDVAAGVHAGDEVAHAHHRGDAEGAGQDGGVARGSAELGDQRDHAAAAEGRRVGRRQLVGHRHAWARVGLLR